MPIHRGERVRIIQENYSDTLKILQIKNEHVRVIASHSQWREKFEKIQKYQGYLYRLGFTGPKILRILNGTDWCEKLFWVINEYFHTLKPIGFNPTSIGYILYTLHWREKIAFAQEHYVEKIAHLGLTPLHFALVVSCGNWEDRVQYLEQHFAQLKSNGFTANGIVRIMKSRDWKSRMSWIEKNFPSSGYSALEAQKILATKQWYSEICRR